MEHTMEQVKRFVVGGTYFSDYSDGKSELVTVEKRTATTITVSGNIIGGTARCKLHVRDGIEVIDIDTGRCSSISVWANTAVSEPEIKEETTMAKKVNVSKVVVELKTAQTADELYAVLMTQKKADMVSAYEELTGKEYGSRASGKKKEELAGAISRVIMLWKKDEAFRAKSYEEKVEILTRAQHYQRIQLAFLFNAEEIQTLAGSLGLYFVLNDTAEKITNAVIRELRINEEKAVIGSVKDDSEALKEVLEGVNYDTLQRLAEECGLTPENANAQMLFEYYTGNLVGRRSACEVFDHVLKLRGDPERCTEKITAYLRSCGEDVVMEMCSVFGIVKPMMIW